jgi:hypothetical protein
MVGEAGIEPTTPGLEGRCSIRLSYSPASIIVASNAFVINDIVNLSHAGRGSGLPSLAGTIAVVNASRHSPRRSLASTIVRPHAVT